MERADRNRTKKKIQKRIAEMDQSLRNAEEYVDRNVNVVGSSSFHHDWNGKSGHPLWMQNYMIPRTERARAHKEKALERILAKEREKKSEAARNYRKKDRGDVIARGSWPRLPDLLPQ